MKRCIKCNKTFDHESWRCPSCLHEPEQLGGHLAFAPELAADSEGFEAHYFATLAELEAGSFWFRSRNQLLSWALQRYFPEAENFFEIGCGTGFVLSGIRRALPELTLSGSEIFSAGLTFAGPRLPGIELFQMDARRIPFREEFDVIGVFDVLEHIKEDEDVLCEMYQATRKGGGVMITVPHHRFLWSESDELARHVRRYRSLEIKDKARKVGFKTLRVTSFVSLLLPLLIVSRFKRRLSGEGFDPTSELRIGSLMNSMFEKILDTERAMIRTGLSLPVGSSLLLIARRN